MQTRQNSRNLLICRLDSTLGMTTTLLKHNFEPDNIGRKLRMNTQNVEMKKKNNIEKKSCNGSSQCFEIDSSLQLNFGTSLQISKGEKKGREEKKEGKEGDWRLGEKEKKKE